MPQIAQAITPLRAGNAIAFTDGVRDKGNGKFQDVINSEVSTAISGLQAAISGAVSAEDFAALSGQLDTLNNLLTALSGEVDSNEDAVATSISNLQEAISGVQSSIPSISGLVSEEALSGILAEYAKIGEGTETSGSTPSGIDPSALSGFVTEEALSGILAEYAKNEALSGFAQSSALSVFVTEEALSGILAEYAKKGEATSGTASSGTQDLSAYATKSWVTGHLTDNYPTNEDIVNYLEENYVSKEALSGALENITPSGYVSIETYNADIAALSGALASLLADMETIKANAITVIED